PIQYDKDGNTYYDRTNIISRAEMKLYRARMQAIREAVGDEVDIIFECHSLPGVTSAIQLGEIAKEFDCMFFEEPVNYLN
ncbi:enolase C-terminal domain-like protein, partial [Psychrobacter sp. CAL606-MNA-CIBAN-0158]